MAAPVAPGMIIPVGIQEWRLIEFGECVDVKLRPCTVALDGERAFTLRPEQNAHVRLSDKGPRVVLIEPTLRAAAIGGVFRTKQALG